MLEAFVGSAAFFVAGFVLGRHMRRVETLLDEVREQATVKPPEDKITDPESKVTFIDPMTDAEMELQRRERIRQKLNP